MKSLLTLLLLTTATPALANKVFVTNEKGNDITVIDTDADLIRRATDMLLDAIRAFDEDTGLKGALGDAFSAAFIKMKTQEWNAYTAHLTQWERDTTLDI